MEQSRKNYIEDCNIKSLYDEKRIVIKQELNPVRIDHCGRNLFGVIFEPIKKHLFLLKFLLDVDSLDLYSYNKFLSEIFSPNEL